VTRRETQDVARSRDFYVRVLGGKVVLDGEPADADRGAMRSLQSAQAACYRALKPPSTADGGGPSCAAPL
jgi:hypothetical protein